MSNIDSAGRLTAVEAASRIGLRVSTLVRMRKRGDGPEFYKLGNRVRYAPEAVDRWLESRRGTKSEPRRTKQATSEQRA